MKLKGTDGIIRLMSTEVLRFSVVKDFFDVVALKEMFSFCL